VFNSIHVDSLESQAPAEAMCWRSLFGQLIGRKVLGMIFAAVSTCVPFAIKITPPDEIRLATIKVMDSIFVANGIHRSCDFYV